MSIAKSNQFGRIDISTKAIADLAGSTSSQVYGVLGLVNKKSLRKPLLSVLSQETFSDGVSISKNKNGYEISVFLIVSKDVKLSEVVVEVQKQVSYMLSKTFGISFSIVNVFIHAIK